MQNRKFLLCVLSAVLCLTAIFAMPASQIQVSAIDKEEAKETIDDLSSKYEQLEKEHQQIQNQINSAKTEKDKKLEAKRQLDQQIGLTQEQISILGSKISLLEEEIDQKQQEIEEKQMEIDDNMIVFQKRVRAGYMAGKPSTLSLVLGAENFSQALMRAKVIERIALHDRELVDALVQDRTAVEDALAQVNKDKEDLQSSKEEMDVKRQQLGGQLQTTAKQIQDINQLEKEYLANQKALEKMMKETQSEIDSIYAQLESMGDYVGGEFAWPVPGFTQVSSVYGWRFNNTDFHTGIDITGGGVYGNNIVAANSGKVVFVNLVAIPGRGYGKYLIIDHGGGFTTLYGHASSINVNVGDYVTRGQPVAKVGSTGWSTGPHLHFEIRLNGKHTNPWPYLS